MHKILTFIVKFICMHLHYLASCSQVRRQTWFEMFGYNTMTEDIFTDTNLVFAEQLQNTGPYFKVLNRNG